MCSPPNKDFWYTIKKVHSMENYYMESSLYYGESIFNCQEFGEETM